jgi:hypothetical protein
LTKGVCDIVLNELEISETRLMFPFPENAELFVSQLGWFLVSGLVWVFPVRHKATKINSKTAFIVFPPFIVEYY